MLKTSEILEKFDLIERGLYEKMIKAVNIPDLYKCIAQFAGLKMSEVKDDVVVDYLKTWAKNKYTFWKMLGEKTQLDIPFTYEEMDSDRKDKYFEIEKKFPIYGLWLRGFRDEPALKISSYDLDWNIRNAIEKYFPNFSVDGCSITHFFKKYLQAPDELVTMIGRVYENTKVEATFTMSIDPIDIMLASENPYNWVSCYRLETGDRDGSHADGCMAAMLDSASMVTYVWNNSGKFSLYNNFKFTDVRYKRMRMWIALSKDLKAIHFNDIYPGRSDYKPEFRKQIRGMVEKVVAEYLGEENSWRANKNIASDIEWTVERIYPYGYSEYHNENIYVLKSLVEKAEDMQEKAEFSNIEVFDEPIKDALDEGVLIGSYWDGEDWNGDQVDYDYDDDDESSVEYNGKGFLTRNYTHKNWCEMGQCYCRYMTEDGECLDHDCYDYECAHEDDNEEDDD